MVDTDGTGTSLQGRAVALLVAPEGAEQVELTDPWRAVEDAGGSVTLVSTQTGAVQAFNHLDRGSTFEAGVAARAGVASDFDALMLPGGVANPDFLRTQPDAVAFVRSFFDAGKPVAAICHAAWTLIEAEAVRGRRMTSYPSLQTDLRNAGAEWVDEEVVVCPADPAVLVTSRGPDDLPAFCRTMVEEFAAARGT